MPRDVNGVYTLPVPWNPVIPDTIIESDWANNTLTDIASQLNNVLTRDGVLGPTSPMKFPNGTAALPAVTFASAPTTGLFYSSGLGFSFGGAQYGILTASGWQFNHNLAVIRPSGNNAYARLDQTSVQTWDFTNIATTGKLQISNTSGAVVDFNLDKSVEFYSTVRSLGGGFYGVGTNLTALNANNLGSGTVPSARMSGTYAISISGNAATATTATSATSATTATNLSGGTVNGTTGTFSGAVSASSFSGSGTALTALNASNLGSGTVPSARMSGTYAISISGNAATATSATSATSATTASNLASGAKINGFIIGSDPGAAIASIPVGGIVGANTLGSWTQPAGLATAVCNATQYLGVLGPNGAYQNIQYGTWRALGNLNSTFGLWIRVA